MNKVLALDEEYSKLSDAQLKAKTEEFKERLQNGETLDDILPEAFAVVKETARRFAENEEVEVTATDRDRDLSAVRDSVTIRGDKAYYKNT